jgi:Protein kinase domain
VKPLRFDDPREVGRYQLLGRLGAGGMGEVFLGQSPGGRLVAVKLIRGELAADREFRVRFAREVAAARHVSGMFTAPVVDADLDAPRPWLVTAYVPGPSLAEAVDTQGPLPVSSVLTLAAGLAEGLEAIHSEGMVHRDLKPSNVLLASDGPRIIDFGISRAADATVLTRANIFVGSPGYMSPEQALGDEVGPASDIFSLGAVLTFAAVGASPFGDGTVTTLLYRVAHDPPATDRLPGQLRPLVERCLAKDPRMRPTPHELLTELGAVESGASWLPRPVAEALSGYAQPAPDATMPVGQAFPAPASLARLSPLGEPAAPEPSGSAPSAADPAAPAPGPGAPPAPGPGPPPAPGPGPPAPGRGAPAAPDPRAPVSWSGPGGPVRPARPPSEDFFESLYRPGPAPKRPDAGRVPSTTTPLGWRSDLGRPPRRRRRLGRVLAAAALVLVLAGVGVTALALTSGLHLGGQPTPPTSAVRAPRAVVKAYVAAINAHKWRKVWNLGGKNFNRSYNQMVAGYRTTAHDSLTSIHVHGNVVTVRLRARRTNGTVRTYRISYTVRDGVITGARTKRLATT